MTTAITRQKKSDRYRLLIFSRRGWSESRARYRRFPRARQAALWLLTMSGVMAVHVLDAHGKLIEELEKPRPRKPR